MHSSTLNAVVRRGMLVVGIAGGITILGAGMWLVRRREEVATS